jgi:signal transduction histidine kinase
MRKNESERLQKLRSYHILDSSRDASFDKIARLASSFCEMPFALISLVDENRQWFKSVVGFDKLVETPRSISFCSFTIQGEDVMEVRDAQLDERFRANPLVTSDPNIRFYAGAPLTSPEGYNLGTLCVIDQRPGKLTESQLEVLKILAQQVVDLMELRQANRELSLAKKILEDQQQLLINKARLQTIGELAGGVCHQINNPLAIIVGRSMILRSQLKQRFPEDSQMIRELDVIDQTSQRVSDILKSLRMYSKDLGEEVTLASFNQMIQDALTLISGKLVREKIHLSYEKGPDQTSLINRNQISQVILDLLSNAIEAMVESETKHLEIKLSGDDKNIFLTLTDSGHGIKPEEKQRIFGPFFSTKTRHFGVGLSNALNFVKQHHGKLEILNLKNPTTIQLTIPRSV